MKERPLSFCRICCNPNHDELQPHHTTAHLRCTHTQHNIPRHTQKQGMKHGIGTRPISDLNASVVHEARTTHCTTTLMSTCTVACKPHTLPILYTSHCSSLAPQAATTALLSGTAAMTCGSRRVSNMRRQTPLAPWKSFRQTSSHSPPGLQHQSHSLAQRAALLNCEFWQVPTSTLLRFKNHTPYQKVLLLSTADRACL